MSFNIAAKGTRKECLAELNSEVHHRLSGDGQIVRGMLLGFLADAPEHWADNTEVRYEVQAYGHHQEGSGVPSLTVNLAPLPAGIG
jgi:hypothetical protein